MNVIVNGTARELSATTLAQALDELGYGTATVASAVNGRFVRAVSRDITALADGDAIEIVAPMQGG